MAVVFYIALTFTGCYAHALKFPRVAGASPERVSFDHLCVCLCTVFSGAVMALSAEAGRSLRESVWLDSARYQQAEAAYHQVVVQRRAGQEPQVGVRKARVDGECVIVKDNRIVYTIIRLCGYNTC